MSVLSLGRLGVVVGGVALGLGSAASAAEILHIDLNDVTVSGASGFGNTFTGTVSVGWDAQSEVIGVAVDEVPQGFTAGSVGLVGGIEFVGGVISGGSVVLTIDGQELTLGIVPHPDAYIDATPNFPVPGVTTYSIFAGAAGGTLSSATFAGVDTSAWAGLGGFDGMVVVHGLQVGGTGMDDRVDLEIYAIVPEPGAAGLAMAGAAMGLMGRRRRRAGEIGRR